MIKWFKPAAMFVAYLFVALFLTILFFNSMVRSILWEEDYNACQGSAACMQERGWQDKWEDANQQFNEG